MNIKPVSGSGVIIIFHGMREKSNYCTEHSALTIYIYTLTDLNKNE